MKAVAIMGACLLPVVLAAPAGPAAAKSVRASLTIVADGVPAGKSAKIMIAGKKFRKRLPADGRLRNMKPGTYRVWASPIVVDGGTASVPNLPVKVKVRKKSAQTLHVGYYWNPRVDFYPPSAAQSLKLVDRTVSSVSLSWKNGSAPDLADVALRRKQGRLAPKTLDDGKVIPVGQRASSARDTGVQAGRTYSYSVFMIDTAGNASSPVSITVRSLGEADGLSAGLTHTCALLSDPGSGALNAEQNHVACWGSDEYGQLGDGGGADSALALDVPVQAPVKVVSGGDHSCSPDQDGDLWCWGRNDDGQLGQGTTRSYDGPVRVKIDPVQDVALGTAHTCAALESGEVACWGANDQGQLGAEPSKRELDPVYVPGIDNAVGVAAGNGHSCAVLRSGGVRCWGDNDHGQLGDGTTDDSSTPVGPSLRGVQLITAGVNHTCADISDDWVRCWGGNAAGQLGDGTTRDRLQPVSVFMRSASALSAGAYHTCAIAGGTAKCWGRNNSGRLGDGTTTDRPAPTAVKDLDSPTVVAAGGYHTCAIASGAVRCWGANGHGQLGDRSTNDSSRPVAVDGL